MRATIVAIAVAMAMGTSAPALAADNPSLEETKGGGPVGVGLVAGTTNGVSLKVWPAQTHGIVLHLGAPPILNSLGVHLSYRVHFPAIVAPNGGPALHVQIGPAFRTRMVFSSATFVELGGGVVIGTSITVPSWPVEFFAEVQPTFAGSVSAPGTGLGFGLEGVGGVRISFGKKAPANATVWGTEAPEPEPQPEPEPEPEGEPAPEGTPDEAPE